MGLAAQPLLAVCFFRTQLRNPHRQECQCYLRMGAFWVAQNHSQVFFSPSSKETRGLYPSAFRAKEMSA
jgi:hypothetical protein